MSISVALTRRIEARCCRYRLCEAVASLKVKCTVVLCRSDAFPLSVNGNESQNPQDVIHSRHVQTEEKSHIMRWLIKQANIRYERRDTVQLGRPNRCQTSKESP
jgi:hypothetical protein